MDLITLPGELLSFNTYQKPIYSKNICESLKDSHFLIKSSTKVEKTHNKKILLELDEEEQTRKPVRLKYIGEIYNPSEGDTVIGIVERRFMGIF